MARLAFESFLTIEGALSRVLDAAWSAELAPVVEEVADLAADGRFDAAEAVLDRGASAEAEGARERARFLLVGAMIYGAANAAGQDPEAVDVTQFPSGALVLDSAVDIQFQSVRRATEHAVRRARELVARLRREAEKVADPALAARFNAAVRSGKPLIDVGANLTASRLATFGHLAQSDQNQVTEYQVSEVLDERTCPFCWRMHGRTFRVESELSRVENALLTRDVDALMGLSPFSRTSPEFLERIDGMSSDQLQQEGWGSPPYHPRCRGVLVELGTVEQVETEAPALYPTGALPLPSGPVVGEVAQQLTAIRALERKIAGRRVEHGIAVAPGGKVLYHAKGTRTKITMTPQQQAAVRENPGTVFTHNHPNDSPLSPQDAHSAMYTRMAEVRAVSSDGVVYRLRPGPDGWDDLTWTFRVRPAIVQATRRAARDPKVKRLREALEDATRAAEGDTSFDTIQRLFTMERDYKRRFWELVWRDVEVNTDGAIRFSVERLPDDLPNLKLPEVGVHVQTGSTVKPGVRPSVAEARAAALPDDELEAHLRRLERGIEREDREHLLVVGLDGRVLQKKVGDSNSVSIPRNEVELLRRGDFGPFIFTHNHPGRGTPPSPQDLQLAAWSEAHAVRAVAAKTGIVYELRPPPGGWDADWWLFKGNPAIKQALRWMESTGRGRELRILLRRGDLTDTSFTATFWEELWHRVAETTGLRFRIIREAPATDLEVGLGKKLIDRATFPHAARHDGKPVLGTDLVDDVRPALEARSLRTAQEVLEDVEDEIRGERIERAAVIRKVGSVAAADSPGEVLYRARGNTNSVEFTHSQLYDMYHRGPGSLIITHNHPTGSPFSPQDVMLAARVGSPLAELRVTGHFASYSLRPKTKLTWPDVEEVNRVTKEVMSTLVLQDRALREKMRRADRLSRLGRLAGPVRSALVTEFMEEVWERAAPRLGLEFRKHDLPAKFADDVSDAALRNALAEGRRTLVTIQDRRPPINEMFTVPRPTAGGAFKVGNLEVTRREAEWVEFLRRPISGAANLEPLVPVARAVLDGDRRRASELVSTIWADAGLARHMVPRGTPLSQIAQIRKDVIDLVQERTAEAFDFLRVPYATVSRSGTPNRKTIQLLARELEQALPEGELAQAKPLFFSSAPSPSAVKAIILAGGRGLRVATPGLTTIIRPATAATQFEPVLWSRVLSSMRRAIRREARHLRVDRALPLIEKRAIFKKFWKDVYAKVRDENPVVVEEFPTFERRVDQPIPGFAEAVDAR